MYNKLNSINAFLDDAVIASREGVFERLYHKTDRYIIKNLMTVWLEDTIQEYVCEQLENMIDPPIDDEIPF